MLLIYKNLLIDDPTTTKIVFSKSVEPKKSKEATFVSIDTFLDSNK